ncbi:unnamed protein product [Diabrotica balteata]|uniref:Uncharacterized protein n=1 Tax=Diabrotica balteata TaxID=107213 RepID=A0A9N9XCN6_DIABA|nr:unnamed protein product [Diabrotica balteata]
MEINSESNAEMIPHEISEAAKTATYELLPLKSRESLILHELLPLLRIYVVFHEYPKHHQQPAPQLPKKIHKQMSLEEIKHTFHVDHHDLVPEYEVVPVQHNVRGIPDDVENAIEDDELDSATNKSKIKETNNDGTTNLKLKAFGKPFNLSLIPTRGLFKKGKLKLWTIEPNATAQHGVEYVEIPESMLIDVIE